MKDYQTLTAREKEILSWAAIGKSSFETSVILNLSEDTIKFHIKNATRKLNVANKTAAVAKAIVLRIVAAQFSS